MELNSISLYGSKLIVTSQQHAFEQGQYADQGSSRLLKSEQYRFILVRKMLIWFQVQSTTIDLLISAHCQCIDLLIVNVGNGLETDEENAIVRNCYASWIWNEIGEAAYIVEM